MEYVKMFFTVPVKWTFECNSTIFSIYMWLSFGIPTLVGYASLCAIAFACTDGKNRKISKMSQRIIFIILASLLQFLFVLGIGNIIYYTNRW